MFSLLFFYPSMFLQAFLKTEFHVELLTDKKVVIVVLVVIILFKAHRLIGPAMGRQNAF